MPKPNILIFIHGMTTSPGPISHADEYKKLLQKLGADRDHGAAISQAFENRTCFVEWGHPDAGGNQDRPDQKISAAEEEIVRRCGLLNVQADTSPQNHNHVGTEGIMDRIAHQATGGIVRRVKEEVILCGVGDVAYYCSTDGEAAVRGTVYKQILECLDAKQAVQGARLHIICQSLGVTVAFDFLFGLFRTAGTPDFIQDEYPVDDDIKVLYEKYFKLAQDGVIELGSFNTTASQLPLTVMRKQFLVNRLAQGQRIECKQIGIDPNGAHKWSVYYDRDDVIGFPTRRLFDATTAIEEFEVNTGWRPDTAHSAYWDNSEVIKRMAKLIAGNL